KFLVCAILSSNIHTIFLIFNILFLRMKKLTFKITTLFLTQKFFIERAMELLDRNTIDSYRARVMNPFTILEELLIVSRGLLDNRIQDFRTVESVIQETISLLEEDSHDNILTYSTFDKDFYCEILSSI